MRNRIKIALMIVSVSMFCLSVPAHAKEPELKKSWLTCYLPTGRPTASGVMPRRGIMAGKREWLGKTALIYERAGDCEKERDMRLKEIKPGMVIHCKNDEEKKALLEEAERLGYVWTDKSCPTDFQAFEQTGMTIHFYNSGFIAWTNKIKGVTEFSDLILPELTAEEAIEWLAQHRLDDEYENAFGFASPFDEILNEECTAEDIVKGIAQWKSDHEKKEPEIETVDICRIIEIQPDGRKRCVHEEDLASGSTDAEIKIMVEAELKRYCMEQEGVICKKYLRRLLRS